MKKLIAVFLILAVSACTSKQVAKSPFKGLTFTSLNGTKVALIDQVKNLGVAYVDRQENEYKAINIVPDNYRDKPLSMVQLTPTTSGFNAGLVIPVQDERFIIVQYPPDLTPILICEETHDPCVLNGTLGCGGGFQLGQGETTKDLLQRIIESNEDSGTSLCGPAEGGVET